MKQLFILVLVFLIGNAGAQTVGIGPAQFVPVSTLDVKGNLTIGLTYAATNAASASGMLVEGNVGIATTTAVQKLHLGAGNFQLPLTTAGGTDGVIYAGATSFLHDYSSGIFLGLKAGNFTMTGTNNVAVGNYSNPLALTTGTDNTFVGFNSGLSASTGSFNTFIGNDAGALTTTGGFNLFSGGWAGFKNTAGYDDVYLGSQAGYWSATAIGNVYVGGNAGLGFGGASIGLFTGGNVAIGYYANAFTTWGYDNVFVGDSSGFQNESSRTVCIGGQAGYSDISDGLVAVGFQSGFSTISGIQNTFIGTYAGQANIIGNSNTFVGHSAGALSTATGNTFVGDHSGAANTSGFQNTAEGMQTLLTNTIGHDNTAVGSNALQSNVDGLSNTACGSQALIANTSGSANTAVGMYSLNANNNGSYNTSDGYQALYLNSGGFFNTASGFQALYNTTSSNNTANGSNALGSNTTGSRNTSSGTSALYNNSGGSDNTACGYHAGFGVSTVDFTQCTFLGDNSFPTQVRSNVTMLGYGIVDAQCTGDNQVCIGNTAIAAGGLRAAVTGWTAYSDARFKINVQAITGGLDFILKLKPVTYNVRPRELHKIWGTPDSLIDKIDFTETEKETRIGFIAQDVERAAKECGFNFPGIDIPKNEKQVYTLRYVDFIMPIVKSIQEQQQIIRQQQDVISALQSEIVKMKIDNENRFKKIEEQLGIEAKK